MNITKYIFTLLMTLAIVGCVGGSTETKSENSVVEEVAAPTLLYGIDIDGYEIANDTVRMGETVGGILGRRGVSAVVVDRLDKASKDIFPLRKIRADNAYTTFTRSYTDSLGEHTALDYIVYHKNAIDYVVFGFVGAEWFYAMQSEVPATVQAGKDYISICTIFCNPAATRPTSIPKKLRKGAIGESTR